MRPNASGTTHASTSLTIGSLNDLKIFVMRSSAGSITCGAIRKRSKACFVPFFNYNVELFMRVYIVVRGRSIEHDPHSGDLKRRVELSSDTCGAEPETPEEIFTLNGSVRPQIQIAPGERQFWRLVNASADRYLDLQLEGQPFEIVAMDGMPIALHNPNHRTRIVDHVLLPPAGRLEAIVTGPSAGIPRRLISRCVDTGPDGDPNPAMVLADIVSRSSADAISRISESPLKPALKTLNFAAEEKAPP